MKKVLLLLLLLSLFASGALAGEEGFYYPYSVVDSSASLSHYDEFRNSGELSVLIPGVNQDFVPQGLAYYPGKNLMLFTGYSSNKPKSASTLIAVDMQTGAVVKEVFLKNLDGSFYTGHAGGVCVTDRNIFISGEKQLYRIPLDAFDSMPPSSAQIFAESIPVPCEASYCQVSNGILWVGEFDYYEDNYKTDKSHHIRNKDGKMNKSWILGYEITPGSDVQINPAGVPDYILSVTDRIQGVTFCDDKIYLSQSYGAGNDSTIYQHKNVLTAAPDTQAEVLGSKRPLWILDSKSQEKAILSPSMTEGICTIGDSVYISFESAADTYRNRKEPGKKPSKNPVDRVFKLNPSAL